VTQIVAMNHLIASFVHVTYSLSLIYIAHYRYPNIARSGIELD